MMCAVTTVFDSDLHLKQGWSPAVKSGSGFEFPRVQGCCDQRGLFGSISNLNSKLLR